MKELAPRDELLALQASLFENIRDDIQDYLGKPSAAIQKYQKEYENGLSTYERISNKTELIREVLKSNIVYLGDYHTLRQAQRSVIRILREVVNQRQIVLTLEMAHHEHQHHIDDYMQGALDDEPFLEAIGYRDNWNFDWQNYKQLFDFSKKHSIRVVGLNCRVRKGEQILRKRDLIAASIIHNIHQQNPDALVFVVYGDLHIAPAHIPKHVLDKHSGREKSAKLKQLIIYQNNEQLYDELTRHGLEQKVDVLKISEKQYCVMNTPPWIKLQSYLNWLEHRHPEFVEEQSTMPESRGSIDYYHRLWDMVDTIASFLRIDSKNLDSFNVFTSVDIEFLDFLNKYLKQLEGTMSLEADIIRTEMIYNGTCILSAEGMVYVASQSTNKIAEKLGQFVHARATNSHLYFEQGCPKEQYYFGRILLEAIGYISSKVINFKRKCEHPADFVEFSKQFRGKRVIGRLKDQREISRLVIQHFDNLESYLVGDASGMSWRKLNNKPIRILLSVCQAIGHILGERLYAAVIDNRLEKVHLRNLFLAPITCHSDNKQLYLQLAKHINRGKRVAESKGDRF